MRRSLLAACAAPILGLWALTGATPALADTNVLPAHWFSIGTTGVAGTLRSGSIWDAGTLAPVTSVFDGVFATEGTQWNHGSYFWDQDLFLPRADNQNSITVLLDQTFTFNRFAVQADDNDTYLLEYWNGLTWLNAWTIPPTFTFGLVSRDSGSVTPITTNQLRFTALSGDGYYAVSEIQAFVSDGVPEPASWALLIAGFGGVGAMLRRRRNILAPFLG